jgi:hypothetical protein
MEVCGGSGGPALPWEDAAGLRRFGGAFFAAAGGFGEEFFLRVPRRIHGGGGGAFVNSGSVINETYSGALFTGGTGVQTRSRTFTNLDTAGEQLRSGFSLSGVAGSFEIGVNFIGLKSNASTTILTTKFTGVGSGFTLNDGGSDFVAAPSITYDNGAIYDIAFLGEIGSPDYTWAIQRRGGGNANNTFQYSAGATLSSFSEIQFFWNAPGGSGNDGLIDGVSVIPEPSSLLLGALAGLAALLALRRRKG